MKWFYRNDERDFVPDQFKKKSNRSKNFNPRNQDAAIEMYLSRLEEEILNLNTRIREHNISEEERKAIDSLRNDTSIIIKEADKGSCIVVWDREDYLKEAESQLGDKGVYEKLSGDTVSPLIEVIKSCIDSIDKRGDIPRETLDYFLVDNPKLGRFYLLPKIHKRLYRVPGRPVISNSSYYTENISAFLDFHLKPLATQVKSFVKDTNDFLKKLSSLPNLPSDTILCTADVVGLYPNIPHEDGIESLRRAFDRRDEKISTSSLLELSKCVLENNIFEHNGEVFKQKQGTAIGTKMAPNYAILFMSDLEEKILDSAPNNLKPLVWWRYIDDIFFLWQHGEESLKLFFDHLNSDETHKSVKFTFEYSDTTINFLDVKVYRKGNRLATDLYVKPTDTHQYLDASSCHVTHSKTSIPYSQALRLNRICSEPHEFDLRCNELETWLIKRGYDQKLVRTKVLDARRKKRKDLLSQEKREKTYKLTLTITYHPAFQNLGVLLRKLHIMLTGDKDHKKVFRDVPIVGFRRGKSLKDFLVRAKIPSPDGNRGSSGGCDGNRCQMCPFVKKTSSFADNKNKTYDIRGVHLNCSSTNVVYLLTCKTCGIQYVGSCTTQFRARFANYKSCNKRHKTDIVSQQHLHNHFDLPGHSGFSDFEFTLIDQGRSFEDTRERERFWQYKLKTLLPNGLNECEVVTQ